MSLPTSSPPPPGAPTPPSPSPMHTLIACIKCEEPFTRAPRSEGGNRPFTLPCGHTYCEGCYESFSSPMPVPTCIFCGVESGAPVVDEALCEVVGAVQAAAAGRAAPPPCVECKSTLDEDTEATHVCKDCGNRHLCEDHGTVHLKRKKHCIEMVSGRSRPPTTCPTHLTPLNIFCMTDNTLVCGDCAFLDHRSHEMLSVTAAAAVFAERLRACMERCRVGGEALMRGMQTVLATKAGMVTATEATCEAFGTAVEDLMARMKAGLASVEGKARTLCKQREKDMDAQADELLVTSQQLGSVIALGERALSDGHPVTLHRALGYGERAVKLVQEFEGVRSSAVVDISFALGGVLDAWENHSHVVRQAKEHAPLACTSISEVSGTLSAAVKRIATLEAGLSKSEAELAVTKKALSDKSTEAAGLQRELAAKNAQLTSAAAVEGWTRKRAMKEDNLVSAAVAECERVKALVGVVPPADIHLITGLSRMFRRVETFASTFCGTVVHICRVEAANAAACGEAVLKEVDTVLSVHKDSVAILVYGFLAVNNLTWWNQVGLRATAVRLGLAQAALDAMSRFPVASNANLLRSCCFVLGALVTVPDGKAAIEAGDGARLVRAARAAHPSEEDIQKYSKTVLEGLGVALA